MLLVLGAKRNTLKEAIHCSGGLSVSRTKTIATRVLKFRRAEARCLSVMFMTPRATTDNSTYVTTVLLGGCRRARILKAITATSTSTPNAPRLDQLT
jgi:hypothetical protein